MQPFWRTSIRLREKQHHVAVEQRRGGLPGDGARARPGAPVTIALGWRRTGNSLGERPEMDQLNRRAMVRGILCGAAVAGVGLALPPGAAEAMPIDASLANGPDRLIEDVQWGPPPRHWHGNN